MIRKLSYIFIALFLLSCGNSNLSDSTANTSKAASASKEAASPALTVQSILSEAEKGGYKEGELLVKFKSGVAVKTASSVHKAMGTTVKRRFIAIPTLEHVKLPPGTSVKNAIGAYMSNPNVEYAEPNYIGHVTSTIPNDTYFNPQQWALNNTGTFAHGTAGADIKMPQAWDITQGSSSIALAVVDTGIDYTHPDLVGNIWTNPNELPFGCADGIDHDNNGFINDCYGWDFVNNTNTPLDDNGHGTHVAGIMGAAGNNGMGIAGMMWRSQLMAVKVCDANGDCATSDVVAGIEYAIVESAKAINLSLGTSQFSQSLFDIVNVANTSGILVIAAAGNDGANNDLAPVYPASLNLPNIIAVAATDQNDMRTSFSNFGPNSVHVAAPGNYILSTITPGLSFSLCTGSIAAGYDFCSGTSMAAPHVTGLVGLLLTYYPDFTSSQIRATILRYVDFLPTLVGWVQTGGRINAYKALSSLLTPTSLTATAASSSQIALAWTANATGEDGYSVERSVSGGPFAQIAQTGPNVNTFTDSGVSPSTTYSYQVQAFNSIPANSAFSNQASATTPADPSAAPTGSGGSGGGCSIGARQNVATAMADLAVLLLPLACIALIRLKRRYRDRRI